MAGQFECQQVHSAGGVPDLDRTVFAARRQTIAGRVEGDRGHGQRVALERMDYLPRQEVAQSHAVIDPASRRRLVIVNSARDGQLSAIGAQGDRANVGFGLPGHSLHSRLDIPGLDGVAGDPHELTAVGKESEMLNPFFKNFQPLYFRICLQIPQANRFVRRAGNHALAIGAEGQARHAVLVAFQRGNRLPGDGVPEDNGLRRAIGAASASDPLSVRVENDRSNRRPLDGKVHQLRLE